MSEAEGCSVGVGLALEYGVGCSYHVAQEEALVEWHVAVGLGCWSVAQVPLYVDDAPEVVDFLLGEDAVEVFAETVALHVGSDVEE